MSQLGKTVSVSAPLGSSPALPQAGGFVPVSEDVANQPQSQSLFERFAWLYIFCRENLFRDDTQRIIRALWPTGVPAPGTNVIELGCGPGFYSCRLAERFPRISVLGIDDSEKQIAPAREKAKRKALANCTFEQGNVLALACADESFDCLIASRLFTVLPRREQAVAEMQRVLRSGGRCFIAEPRYALWASIPLLAMWMLASLSRHHGDYREPRKASVLSGRAFEKLLATQPWKAVKTWRDGRYQYALCEKG